MLEAYCGVCLRSCLSDVYLAVFITLTVSQFWISYCISEIYFENFLSDSLEETCLLLKLPLISR